MFGFEITKLFFDKKAVTSKTDRATRNVLSRFGAFVRRTAKSSIRTRKGISAPGSPPSSHTGLLKKFIFFGYEPQRRSVVIGPARLNQRGRGALPGAPSLLEYGGVTAAKGKRKRARYRPRPFMGPAFIKERTKMPALWRDSIK